MSSFREYMFSDYLEDDEEVLYVCHRHLIILVKDFIRVFLIHFGLAFLAWYAFPQMFWISVVWAAIGMVRLLLYLQDWYYDSWLVTNMGIIGVQWTGYFDRTSTRGEYVSIEGVNYKIKGFIATI